MKIQRVLLLLTFATFAAALGGSFRAPVGKDMLAKCYDVQTNMSHLETYPYLKFHYCDLPSVPALSIILFVLLAAVMFHLLYRTADCYFTEGLKALGKTFRLSDDLVGMTLVTLGNGAPDFFTALAGSQIAFPVIAANSTVLLTITCAIVLLTKPNKITRISNKKQIIKRPFYRNFAHLLVGFMLLVALAETIFKPVTSTTQKYPIWIPICMIVLYFGYLGFGIVEHLLRSKQAARQRSAIQETGWNADEGPAEEELKNVQRTLLDQLGQVCSKYFKPKRKVDLLLNILALPVTLFTELLIIPPKFDLHGPRSEIQKYQTIFNPLLSINFILYALGQYHRTSSFWVYLVMVLCTLGFSLLLGASFQTQKKTPKWPLMHLAWSFVMSIVCLYYSSTVLLGVIGSLAVICTIPSFYIALLLAWANSLGDMISGASLVKKGNFPIVSTTVFASIIQNVLLVFAIAMLKNRVIPLMERRDWIIARVTSWYLLATLLVIGVAVPLLGFRIHPKCGFVLVGFYVAYLATVCTLAHVPI